MQIVIYNHLLLYHMHNSMKNIIGVNKLYFDLTNYTVYGNDLKSGNPFFDFTLSHFDNFH